MLLNSVGARVSCSEEQFASSKISEKIVRRALSGSGFSATVSSGRGQVDCGESAIPSHVTAPSEYEFNCL